MGGLPQPATGPLINAMLFISTALLGWLAGVILGFMTPIVALLRGQLPPLLAPMVPFISISNVILVLTWFFIKKKFKLTKKINLNPVKQPGNYLAIVCAAMVKFLFLSFSVKILLPVLIAHDLPAKFVLMMTFPQLITAFIGGIIALVIYEMLYRVGMVSDYGIK